MQGPDRSGRPARLLAHARFVGAWGHLVAAGLDEAAALAALAEDASDADLRELARAGAAAKASGAAGALDAALASHGGCLDAWLSALLCGPRRPEHLIAAAALLEREARGDDPPRASLWRKLSLLAAGGAPLGDALSALAREARERELGPLSEGLYGAARRARGGAGLLEALRGLGGAEALERAALESTREGSDAGPLLATLEALVRLPAAPGASPSAAGAPAPGAAAAGAKLTNLAQAATAGAAPLRRGIERVLSGIEEALGIGPPPDASSPAALAREAVQARAARTGSDRLAAAPPPAGAPAPGPAAVAPAPGPAAVAPAAGKKKTIGMDSGPVPLPGYDAGKGLAGDAARLDAGRAPADPVEAWTRSFERARSKLAVAELTPREEGPALVREVEAELRRLRQELPGGDRSRKLTAQLDDLELRLLAWREQHAPSS